MIRSRLATLRYVASAIFWLIALVCCIEVVLQGRSLYRSAEQRESVDEATVLVPSAQIGQSLKPLTRHNVTHPDGPTRVSWSTNSLGLRGPEWPLPKPPGVFRVLCLGDENILAPETANGETACDQLQALLQTRTRYRVEVINGGVPGYCPLLCYLLIRHRLIALQPDVVVLNFDMSDVADDHRHRPFAIIGSDGIPVACSSALKETRRPPSKALFDRFELARLGKSQLEQLLPKGGGASDTRDIDAPEGAYAWLADDPPDWSVYIRQALAPIEHLRALTAGLRIHCLLATYPVPWQVSSKASSAPGVRRSAGVPSSALYSSRAPFELLASFSTHHQIPFLDTSSAFQAARQPERLFLRNSPRFSPQGHEFYAQQLSTFIVSQVPGVWTNSSVPPRQLPTAGNTQVRHASQNQAERLVRPPAVPMLRRAPDMPQISNPR